MVQLTCGVCMSFPSAARLGEKSLEGDIPGTVIKSCTILDRDNAITMIRCKLHFACWVCDHA